MNQEQNKELKNKVETARKIGVQNIVDKLLDCYQADITSDTLDPNLISWIREKTKFITWLAGKTSDLYSDKKENISKNTVNNVTISWLNTPELEQKFAEYDKLEEEEKIKINN